MCTDCCESGSGNVNDVAFHPTRPDILASGSDDETMKIWNLTTSKCESTMGMHTSQHTDCTCELIGTDLRKYVDLQCGKSTDPRDPDCPVRGTQYSLYDKRIARYSVVSLKQINIVMVAGTAFTHHYHIYYLIMVNEYSAHDLQICSAYDL